MNILLSIIFVVIVYLIFVLIQVKTYKNTSLKIKKKFEQDNEEIKFNLENKKDLENTLYNELKNRVELLENMDYNDWIEYNQKNIELKYKNHSYYLTIWRKIPKKDNFILDVYQYPQFLNSDRNNKYKRINANNIFKKKFARDESLLINMYYDKSKPYIKYSYVWIPDETQNQVNNTAIALKFNYNEDTTGIILYTYDIENISEENHIKYFSNTKRTIYIIQILTLIIAFILIFINRNNKHILIKPILFIIIIMSFLTIFINSTESSATTESETQKESNINSGILGVSFLVAVNIFIISKLEKDKVNKNFIIENSFMFVLVLICLLLSAIKLSNYSLLKDLTKTRLRKELLFNICILLNIYIIITFGLYIFKIV